MGSAERRRLLAGLLAACAAPAAAELVDNEMARYWRQRVARFLRDDVARGAIVFVGDSMTERFELDAHFGDGGPVPLVNRGIGGDKVGGWRYLGLLDRLDDTVLALQPRQVVLMIGVNDLVFAATPRSSLLEGMDRLLSRLAAARVPTVVQAVLPVRGRLAVHNPAIQSFNRETGALAARHGHAWIDFSADLADEEGHLRAAFASDDVHLSGAGYRIWAARLRPVLMR